MLSETEKTGKIGGWEFDVNTLTQTWTEETFRILEIDLSQGEPTVPKGIDFINPPYRSMANEAIQSAIENGEPYDQEWEITTTKGNKRWVHSRGKANWENGKVKSVSGSFQDITEQKNTEEAVNTSLKRYQSFIEVSGELGWTTNAAGEVLDDIPSFKSFTGQTYDEVKGWGWSKAVHPDDVEHTKQVWEKAIKTKSTYEVEYRMRRYDGVYRLFEVRGVPVFRDDGSILEWVGTCIDITERKKTEKEQEILSGFLNIVNRNTPIKDLIKATVVFFKDQSGCEAVGIRIKHGEDFPYCEAKGFPDKFISSGNSLCARSSQGDVLLDSKGNPVLECKCGNVISGRFDPSKEFFTEYGSFWTNSATKLLATTSEVDHQACIRNRCNGEGYESVALIPLKAATKTLGLIQLNDHRKDMFSLETISLWEHVSREFSLALERSLSEEAMEHTTETLRQSEEKYRGLFESTQDGIVISDAKGVVVSANQAAATMFGYMSAEELVNVPAETLYADPRDRWVLFEVLAEKGSAKDYEAKFKRNDGKTFDARVTVVLKRDLQGNVLRSEAILRDSTERKQIKAALRQERDKLESVTTAISVGLVIVSKDFRVLWANDFIKRYKGDTLGKLCYATLNSLDAPCPDCGVVKVFAGKAALDVHEYCSTNIDGNPYWVEISASPIMDEKGNVVSVVEVAVDITERKKNEEKLTRMMNQLVLINEKLGVVGSLTRHDVRNKLSTVTGYAYLLKKKHGDHADIIEDLTKMEQAVAESVKISDFAKMYEQLGVEELTYVDVEKTVNEAVALFSVFNLKVVNDCQGLMVLADSFLRQLFYNFIDNTRKYGKKTTTIRVHYEKADQDSLKLIYEDDGVGISKENKLNLFKEGFSAGGSTGLGLFLIRKMVDVYGWQIQENGEAGNGVRFVITVPKIGKNGKENCRIAP